MEKKINVLSLFDGISCGQIALHRAGIEINNYYAYEIEQHAIDITRYNYPNTIECGDVTTADFTQYKGIDLLIGGSPCFVAGTMIMTSNGNKPIEDIKVGDMVLTHKGQYKKVKEIMHKITKQTVIIHAENSGVIECTPEHPFYTKNVSRDYINRQYKRKLSNEFEWTSPLNFHKIMHGNFIKEQTYLCSVSDSNYINLNYNGVDMRVNQYNTKHVNTLNFKDENLWYIIGRWVGDGWFIYKYKRNQKTGCVDKKLSGIRICCGKHESTELETILNLTNLKYGKSEEKTTYRFSINNLELALYMQKFGNGANNKHLHQDVFNLPKNLALSFIKGYFDADGHISNNVANFSTISKKLAYDIKYMINKYYKTACGIIKCNRNNKHHRIENRIINYNTIYMGFFYFNKQSQSHFINDENYIFAPYKKINYSYKEKMVYNLSVEDDESYTANGLVVHNCTNFSQAKNHTAKNKKETDINQGIGWELFMQYVRALKEAKPKYFLYENNYRIPKNIVDNMSKELGVQPILINSGLVSAQSRKRLYWTNIPDVTQPIDKGILVKDIIIDDPSLLKVFDDRIRNTLIKCKNYIKYDLGGKGHYSQQDRLYYLNGKGPTVPRCRTESKFNVWLGEETYKKTCPIEIERLQTLPDNYTQFGIDKNGNTYAVKKTNRFEAIGNGWTVDVIVHIFQGLKD